MHAAAQISCRLDRPSSRWRRWCHPLACAAILAGAIFLRISPAKNGLPYIGYVDEGHVLHQVMWTVRTKNWDLGWYLYPSLPIYLNSLALLAYSPIYEQQHGHALAADFPEQSGQRIPSRRELFYNQISPGEVIHLSRLVSVFFSVGTVVAVGLLASGLAGRNAGLLAAALVACCPALLTRSHLVIVDTLAAFFATCSLLAAWRLSQARPLAASSRPGPGTRDLWCIVAGVLAGLAFACKYPAGAAIVAAAWGVLWGRLAWGRKLRETGFLTLGLLLGIFAGMPSFFLRFNAVVQDQKVQLGLYASRKAGGPSYFAALMSSGEVGWLVTGLGLIGLATAWGTPPLRTFTLGCLAFAAVMLAPLLPQHYQPFRNLLPLIPLLCVFAAIGAVAVWQRLARWVEAKITRPQWCKMAVPVLVVAVGIFSTRWFPKGQPPTVLASAQSRVTLVDWAAAHLDRADRTLVLQDLAIPPEETARIPGLVRQIGWENFAAELERNRYDYVLAATLKMPARGQGRADPRKLEAYNLRLKAWPIQKQSGSQAMVASRTIFIPPQVQLAFRQAP